MRDLRLSDLNFRELLHYGGQPRPAGRYDPELECRGYCVDCEVGGLVEKDQLELMSHGCDSADFKAMIGPMPQNGDVLGVDKHILFLLENPGMDYENGRPIPFEGCNKQPPVNRYYFNPVRELWSDTQARFGGNFYGPYFAHIMWMHQLENVYITNLAKCNYKEKENDSPGRPPVTVKLHCMDVYLKREIEYFEPKLIVCFGKEAENGFKSAYPAEARIQHVRLDHPSYICDRWGTARRLVGGTSMESVQNALINRNDDRLSEAIAHLA